MGVATFADVKSIGTATFAVFDLAAAQDLFDKTGSYDRILVAGDLSKGPAGTEVRSAAADDRFDLDGLKSFVDILRTILLAFAGVALSCDTGSSWTLQRLVGRAKALELMYFPRTVGAEESLALGLASSVVPADQVAATVAELATRLAAGPTVALASIRASVAFAAEHTLAEALAFTRLNLAAPLELDTSAFRR